MFGAILLGEECAAITFYSDPVESFLTSVFRLYEVFGCSQIIVFSSKTREAEASNAVNLLRNYVKNTEFSLYPIFPDPSDLNSFDGLSQTVYNVLRDISKDSRIVIATYTGSRLEVSATILAASRQRESVSLIYTPFFFGPWNNLFYPFTPKPLEPIAILHPSADDVKSIVKPSQILIEKQDLEKLLDNFVKPPLSRLRRGVAYTQYKINAEYATSSIIYPLDFRCRGLRITITVNKIPKIVAEARDYCNYDEVIELVHSLGSQIKKFNTIESEAGRAIELIAKFSGLIPLAVEECTYDCEKYKDVILTDFLSEIGAEALMDTNIFYTSLHMLLHESKINVKTPLCAYVELLGHVAHYKNPYEELRSAIASLILDEIRTLGLQIDENSSQRPCEIGIALAKGFAVTSDKKAFDDIFKFLNIKAVFTVPKPIKEVKLLRRENMRRIAYAYYAIAQFKTVVEMPEIAKALSKLGIEVKFE